MSAFISLIITLFTQFLYILFKIAQKLKLTIPLWYLLIAVSSTFFSRWVPEHEQIVLNGLYILIGITLIRWIVLGVHKIYEL